jgi:UDP-2,3-diacylglucosamine hydrolase
MQNNLSKKVYFASDVHLGYPNATQAEWREKLFVKWLDSIKEDALELYLVGDIFDFWYEYKKVVPRGFVRFLGKIAELTDAGIAVHFFTGNHDMWVSDYLTNEVGVILHREAMEQTIFNKKFYIAHGDGLGPGDYGYKILKRIFSSKTLQFLFSRLHPNFSLWLAHGWSNKSRSQKGIIAQSYKKIEDEILYKYSIELLKNKEYDYLVFGHRHLVVNQPINDSVYINLGDWITNFSYGVFDGNKFSLLKFEEEI